MPDMERRHSRWPRCDVRGGPIPFSESTSTRIGVGLTPSLERESARFDGANPVGDEDIRNVRRQSLIDLGERNDYQGAITADNVGLRPGIGHRPSKFDGLKPV